MSRVYPDSSQFVNFDALTFSVLWNVLSEDNTSLEFYNTSSNAKCSEGLKSVV